MNSYDMNECIQISFRYSQISLHEQELLLESSGRLMQVMKIEEDEDGTRHVVESSDNQVYTAQNN